MNYIKERNINKESHFFLQLLFIVLLLQQAIIYNFPKMPFLFLISSLDEISALVLLFIFFFRAIGKYHILKEDHLIGLFVVILILIGLISNLFSHLQPLSYAVIDMLTCGRFVFIYLGVRAIYDGKIPEDFLYRNFNAIAKSFSGLFFALMVHDYLFQPFFELFEFRYFALSTKLFYPHPTYLANACIILMCILISSYRRDKTNMVYICLLAVVVLMTFRAKAIAFVVLFFLLLLCVLVLQMRSKFFLFLPLILGGLYIGWDQLQFYFVKIQDSARVVMLRDCVKIANTYFPLGSGFATYGSFMANEHYSPLYSALGYNRLQGMSENAGTFLSDSFWPIVIGQFGYFGLACFLVIVLCFFLVAFQLQRKNPYDFIALVSILLYMMISSAAESSFFNPFSAFFFLIFGLIVSQNLSKQADLHGETEPKPQSRFKSRYIK